MDVNIDNFHAVRKLIKEKHLIQRSTYIGFDLEFTGIRFENNERERSETLLNEKYLKMSAVASKYNIIQCGLTFVVEEEHKKMAYPFNFYVFPRETGNNDPTISLQAGCMKFNTSQGMDWNMWIKKGINYVKIADMHRLLNPEKIRSFKEIFESMDPQAKELALPIIKVLESFPDQQEEKFVIPKYAVYIIKKGVDQYILEKQLFLETSSLEEDDLNEILTIKRITAEEVMEKAERKQEEIAGFTLLFYEIWKSKKIFVGHNCLYDILFIYASFVEKLPVDYTNFKNIISENRQFYDTKYLATHFEKDKKLFQKGTSLEEMQKFFTKEAMDEEIIQLSEGFEKYKKPSLHEAGFDSYVTMCVFFHFKNVLQNLQDFEGKLNVNKSFFEMNLRKPNDSICKDMMIFAIPIASYVEYVSLEELRKSKYTETKKIREWLKEELPGYNFGLVEGLKEIFVYSKGREANEILMIKMNEMKRKEIVANPMSFISFIKSRSEYTNHTKSE